MKACGSELQCIMFWPSEMFLSHGTRVAVGQFGIQTKQQQSTECFLQYHCEELQTAKPRPRTLLLLLPNHPKNEENEGNHLFFSVIFSLDVFLSLKPFLIP